VRHGSFLVGESPCPSCSSSRLASNVLGIRLSGSSTRLFVILRVPRCVGRPVGTGCSAALHQPLVYGDRESAIEYRLSMAAKRNNTFDLTCPDCGALLKVDPDTQAILSHTPAPRKRTFEDFETAARAMREQDERKENIFRQSVEAEKNKQALFDKKFEEALRKAKETPDEGKPLREFDLD
jgi:hypothetical protein